MYRAILISLALSLAAPAIAKPPPPKKAQQQPPPGDAPPPQNEAGDHADRDRAMMAVVKSELDLAHTLIQAAKASLEAGQDKPSEPLKKAWDEASKKHAEAKAKADRKEFASAYQAAQESLGLLGPVMDELLGAPKPPEPILNAVTGQMKESGNRVRTVGELVAKHGGPDGKNAVDAARNLHTEAGNLWRDGKRRDAFHKLAEAHRELGRAIRAVQ